MKKFVNSLLFCGLVSLFASNVWGATVRTVEVHAKRFAYVPAEITMKQGETVKLELVSDDVAHSLRIDPLNVNVRMPVGETVQTTVTAEQTGDFKGRCTVYCGKGHGEMFFTIHVVNR